MLRQGGLADQRRGADVVEDLDDRVLGVDDAEVDDGVDLDGDVVTRDGFLGGNFEGDDAQVDFAHTLGAGDQEEKARPACSDQATQAEDDAALVFLHDLDGRGRQQEHDKGDGDENDDDGRHRNLAIWDLHESDERDRGAIFAALKAHLAHPLEHPGRAAFIVDEAVMVTEDELGARTLGDLVRRGRHFGPEVHVLTQRVTDWFDSRSGRTIQSVAASKWFGQMEARALDEIAPSPGHLARGA